MLSRKVPRYFWYILTLAIHSLTLAFTITNEAILSLIIILSVLILDCRVFTIQSNRKYYVDYFLYTLTIVVTIFFLTPLKET